jgi:hypothetical protein
MATQQITARIAPSGITNDKGMNLEHAFENALLVSAEELTITLRGIGIAP